MPAGDRDLRVGRPPAVDFKRKPVLVSSEPAPAQLPLPSGARRNRLKRSVALVSKKERTGHKITCLCCGRPVGSWAELGGRGRGDLQLPPGLRSRLEHGGPVGVRCPERPRILTQADLVVLLADWGCPSKKRAGYRPNLDSHERCGVALWPLPHLSLPGARQRNLYARRDTSPRIGRAKPPTRSSSPWGCSPTKPRTRTQRSVGRDPPAMQGCVG